MGWTDWESAPELPDGSPLYETPNMRSLAATGVTFANAYASAPVCSPTRASLLTGKNPARTRITDWIGSGVSQGQNVRSPSDWTKNLQTSDVTLPEAMRDAGYDTAFFGKWHLGESGNPATDPTAHGFDSNVGGTASGNPGFAGGFFAGADGAWAGMPGLDSPGTYPASKYLSDALAEEAVAFIGQSQAAADPDPFFLMMSHYLVHTPLQAPGDLINKYSNKISTLQSQGVDLKGHDNPTYAAMVEKMDQSLGLLLGRLDDPNSDGDTSDSVREDTIIVFTSDHGGLDTSASSPTDNAPLREGKGSLYEGGTRVPLIVSWTGNQSIPQGLVTANRAVSHDIYPTLLDLTGVPGDPIQNASMDGVSVRNALEGQTFGRGRVYWHYPHISPQDATSTEVEGGSFVSSVVEGDWKLIYFYDNPRYELYDLSNAISETTSVLLENPGVANALSSALSDYLKSVNAQMPIDTMTNTLAEGPPALTLGMGLPAFHAPFDADHDFRTHAVAGTRWDGVANPADATALESSSGTGTLSMTSNARFVAGDFASPFLYKHILGDFEATMEIAAMEGVNFNVAAIVAAKPSALDQEFVWIGQQDRSNTTDFAQARNIDNGIRTGEDTLSGVFKFFRLVRSGDLLTGFISHDGAVWTEFFSSARPDLPLGLLVGITQGTFSSEPGNVLIEEFSIDLAAPGDFDLDGDVDAADLGVWQTNVGLEIGATQAHGDADLDGDVDNADLIEWQRHFTGDSSSASSFTVPEPKSLAIAGLVCNLSAFSRWVFGPTSIRRVRDTQLYVNSAS